MSSGDMSKALTDAQIVTRIASQTPLWTHTDGTIRRTWRTRGWKATLMAVNAVGHLAELAWHHPEVVATFGSLEVRLNTHDANGVTAKDFALARKIDALLDWRPHAEDGPLEGAPAGDTSAGYFRDA